MCRPILLIMLTALFTSCSRKEAEFQTYTLDVSNIATVEGGGADYLFIRTNAVAVFPLDLSSQNRTLTVMGASTIIEAQTKSACSGTGREPLSENHNIVTNINGVGPIQTIDIADIRSINLEMPYTARNDTFTRIPATVCVGFHIKDSAWVWNFTAVPPQLNETDRKGVAQVVVDEKNVDIIGILFDGSTNISKITFEARRVD